MLGCWLSILDVICVNGEAIFVRQNGYAVLVPFGSLGNLRFGTAWTMMMLPCTIPWKVNRQLGICFLIFLIISESRQLASGALFFADYLDLIIGNSFCADCCWMKSNAALYLQLYLNFLKLISSASSPGFSFLDLDAGNYSF
ncbi:hypothetical protein MA16_Dca026489 [Dendrobium catenatum]|uniref:Uncharacterized protein n=1 Tax=Dendrobium catenatum TaxID=906689 RepID=A0A2I0WJF8_9ASPA|nr:hypothetical protein MA16_Dca026489 [Dendrobium catenatum]